MIDVEIVISPHRQRAFFDIIRSEPEILVGIPGKKGLTIRATQFLIDRLDAKFGQDIFFRKLT